MGNVGFSFWGGGLLSFFTFLILDSVYSVPVAQWLEHCVSSAKVVGSIPREHMY